MSVVGRSVPDWCLIPMNSMKLTDTSAGYWRSITRSPLVDTVGPIWPHGLQAQKQPPCDTDCRSISLTSRQRDDPTKYEPQVIEEKDEVNKKYGAFQHLNVFRDSETGLLDAKEPTQSMEPQADRARGVLLSYEGFPPRFKPMFEEIKDQTNEVFEEAGAASVLISRRNDGGVERHLGDIRYSFVVWHQDIDTTRGLLGYGPSSVDPTTGEKLSANASV